MARFTFLWHLHQPLYRTADQTAHAPWVLLHAGGEYLTLLHALDRSGARGHVLNLTPVFLEQLEAYRDGRVNDPLLAALRTPARELGPVEQQTLVRWAFQLHPRQIGRLPRLAELADRIADAAPSELAFRVTAQDLTDLQVLLVLAHAWPNLALEPAIGELAGRDRGFSDAARAQAVEWLESCPGRLLAAYRSLADRPGIEISTSPWGHPIVPLLIDTGVVVRSWAPRPAPEAPPFAAPEDAAEQVRRGLADAARFGFRPVGCWPPEGALSEAAVAMYGEHGVRWLVADEGLLAASLGRQVSGETGVGSELFRAWRLTEGGPSLFFRHRALSDYVGFSAARNPDERGAAEELIDQMRRLTLALPANLGVVLALDGENAWTAYPRGGATFLQTLLDGLDHAPGLTPATLAERTAEEGGEQLANLHPGSWIGAVFGTWIGHPEKNRAWELLALAREAGAWRGGDSWLAAEGSDWWWWLGEDNPTPLAALYDWLFRAHLRDACVAAGVDVPPDLLHPIRSAVVALAVPQSLDWPTPVVDGRTTTYFEWTVAAWAEAPESYRKLSRAALRASGDRLYLRVEPRRGLPGPSPVTVIVEAAGRRVSYSLPGEPGVVSSVERVLEAALPLPANGALIALEHQEERLPVEGFWRIELLEVDEP